MSAEDENGKVLFDVNARDRQSNGRGDDPVLSSLDQNDYDELWLFAVDVGDGLTAADCAGITRFRQRGGGLLTTRDHHDLGSSLCGLGGVGAAHFFHSRNPEPDGSRRANDDCYSTNISWPNYHSGANGDYQEVSPLEPIHELLRTPSAPRSHVRFLPAHPHEGAVDVPRGEHHARVIAMGKSQVTGRSFNLAVAFERYTNEGGNRVGRGVAESSFHHFVDYNWDIARGCPSFVTEAPGHEIGRDPRRLADVKAYTRNLALWLAPQR